MVFIMNVRISIQKRSENHEKNTKGFLHFVVDTYYYDDEELILPLTTRALSKHGDASYIQYNIRDIYTKYKVIKQW
jgi:hypothetical protein